MLSKNIKQYAIHGPVTDSKFEVIEHVVDKRREAQQRVIANSSGCYYGKQWMAHYGKRQASVAGT